MQQQDLHLQAQKLLCAASQILQLPAPLLRTLMFQEHPPQLGAQDEGKRQRKQKSHAFLGSMVPHFMENISLSCPLLHEALWLPHLSPALGLLVGWGKDQDLLP